MKLTDAQHKKLLEHLQGKWQAPVTCPVCRNNNWQVPPQVYELREFYGGPLTAAPGTIVPIVPVTCGVCGNVVLINPLIAGIEVKGPDNG